MVEQSHRSGRAVGSGGDSSTHAPFHRVDVAIAGARVGVDIPLEQTGVEVGQLGSILAGHLEVHHWMRHGFSFRVAFHESYERGMPGSTVDLLDFSARPERSRRNAVSPLASRRHLTLNVSGAVAKPSPGKRIENCPFPLELVDRVPSGTGKAPKGSLGEQAAEGITHEESDLVHWCVLPCVDPRRVTASRPSVVRRRPIDGVESKST